MRYSSPCLALLSVSAWSSASAFAPPLPKVRVCDTTLSASVVTGAVAKKTIIAAGAVAGALAGRKILGTGKVPRTTLDKINEVFPGSLTNKALVNRVYDKLAKYGFGSSSLLCTSFCCDEVTRALETDFGVVYNDNFHMGGLSGFPFGGVTSFGAMASHIPDGGSCLVVFGPHVGVDASGNVGTTERRGRKDGGSCCGSAIAASRYVDGVQKGEPKMEPSDNPIQAQQIFVANMLLPYAESLEAAADKMVELPYALYDVQKEWVTDIVKAGAGSVSGDGKIAVLGGIQINTQPGCTDYYLPLSFELYNNKAEKITDLTL